MKIFRLETKNGRVFKVGVNNKSQEKRLFKIYNDSKNNSYEIFIKFDCVVNGVHDIKTFEKLANELI